MDGVTILNTYNSYSIGGAILLASGITGAIIFLLVAFNTLDENIIISSIFVGLAVAIIIGCFAIQKTETTHEVTIDDSVLWIEFSEHYEVVQTRGKILRVKERSADDD